MSRIEDSYGCVRLWAPAFVSLCGVTMLWIGRASRRGRCGGLVGLDCNGAIACSWRTPVVKQGFHSSVGRLGLVTCAIRLLAEVHDGGAEGHDGKMRNVEIENFFGFCG